MYQYILKRLLLTIPTLFGAALLVFLLLRLIPGDICVLRMSGGAGHIDSTAIELCRTELGLDRSYVVQFLEFIWGFIRFDFGKSMWTGLPIVEEISLRFQLSLQIAIMATLTAILLAIPLGTISAVSRTPGSTMRCAASASQESQCRPFGSAF